MHINVRTRASAPSQTICRAVISRATGWDELRISLFPAPPSGGHARPGCAGPGSPRRGGRESAKLAVSRAARARRALFLDARREGQPWTTYSSTMSDPIAPTGRPRSRAGACRIAAYPTSIAGQSSNHDSLTASQPPARQPPGARSSAGLRAALGFASRVLHGRSATIPRTPRGHPSPATKKTDSFSHRDPRSHRRTASSRRRRSDRKSETF